MHPVYTYLYMQQQTNLSSLTKIGLTADQAAVYHYLLENGALSASLLSKRLGITRTLVYKILDDLSTLNLVSKDDSFKVTRFSAAHPYELRKIAVQQKIAAEELANRIETSLAPLVASYNLQSNKPAVHHMEGLSGIAEILEDTLTSSEPIRMFVDTDTLEQEVEDIDAQFAKKRIKLGVKKHILTPYSQRSEAYAKSIDNDLTNVRLLKTPVFEPFYSVMYIYDNKMSYITYKDNVFTGTIVHDPSIYTMQRVAFESLWAAAQ